MALRIQPIIFWLLTTMSAVTSMKYDPNISNGTCYYKTGEESAEAYAPCGNSALGHTFCCQLGDKCVEQNGCVDGDIRYTYLAGCTDPTYEDPSCPYKGNYSDYRWVGLVACDSTGDTDWVGCANDESEYVNDNGDAKHCSCTPDKDEPLFHGPAGLMAYGFLPTSKGGKIDWVAEGVAPTTVIPPPTDDNTRSPTSTTQTLPMPISRSSTSNVVSSGNAEPSSATASMTTSEPTSSSSAAASPTRTEEEAQHKSDAIKIGIGIGVLAGVCIMFCVTYWLRKKFQSKQGKIARGTLHPAGKDTEKTETTPSISNGTFLMSPHPAELHSPSQQSTNSELPGSPAPPLPYPIDNIGFNVGVGMNARFASHGSQNNRISNNVATSPSWHSNRSTSQAHRQEWVYKPFRYQSANLEGIQEMPDHERPQWAQTGYGTYGPSQSLRNKRESVILSGINAGRQPIHGNVSNATLYGGSQAQSPSQPKVSHTRGRSSTGSDNVAMSPTSGPASSWQAHELLG